MVEQSHSNAFPADLPPLDEISSAHAERVAAHIRQAISANGGEIPFSRFMEMALYAPGLGYYSAGSRKLGADGDFVTAPEISSLFGQCLARQIREVLEAIGANEILELGAGTGALAADILSELRASGVEIARYRILEVSGDLQERQRAQLTPFGATVEWITQWPQPAFRGVVIANEVLDAMPVEKFRIIDQRCESAFVADEDGTFVWRFHPANDDVQSALRLNDQIFSDGYESEVSLIVEPWLRGLSESLHSGVCFLIDYGFSQAEYYHPHRSMGTLMCHFRHRAHSNPLILAGMQDITAHVDFSRVARAATANELEVLGYATQANFLLGCGLASLAERSDPNDVKSHLMLMQQVKKLTSPSEMGELFKVLAIGRGIESPLLGFSLRNMRNRL